MGKVVDLSREPKKGETSFLCCSCTEEGTPFAVITYVSDNPFVVSLVCPECEREVPVVNGYVGTQQS